MTNPRFPSGKIRVGIIGASADPFQWGSTAHIPALRSLPQYEIVAVATTRDETATAAAAAHDVTLAFGDYRQMVRHPDVDMVCVITSVMHHHALAMAALEAGKHVFCEWPLGVTTPQAIEMRDLARARGVQTCVGLQNRCAPMVGYVRDLIADRYIGELRCANLARANDQMTRMEMPESWLYFLDKAQANSGLTILGGHALDTLAAYVGEFADVQAYTEVRMDTVTVAETGDPYRITAADHILVQGRVPGGAPVTAHIKMNSPIDKAFHLEISGSKGALIVTSGERLDPTTRQPGIPSEIELLGTPRLDAPFEPMAVPDRYRTVPAATPGGQPLNVAQLYQRFARALLEDAAFDLDFAHGVMRHRLLDTVQQAADAGRRQVFNAAAELANAR